MHGNPGSSGAIPECRNNDIEIIQRYGGGYTGHEALILGFVAISARTCFLQGYPGMAALDATGRVLLDADRIVDGMGRAGVSRQSRWSFQIIDQLPAQHMRSHT